MSQKRRDFQSKPRFGEQKFGGKGKGRGRPPSRGFDKQFEGDSKKSFGRDRDQGDRPRSSGKDRFGDRPARRPRFEDRDDSRGFGAKKFGGGGKRFERRDDAGSFDKPKKFGGGKRFERRDDDARGFDKPKKFGEKRFDRRDDKRDFDRPKKFGAGKRFERRDDDARGFDKPKRFGEKRFGGDKKSFRDRPQRSERTYKRFDDAPSESFDRQPATFETRQKLKSDRPSFGAPSSAFLYGVHPVTEALMNPKRLHQRLLCTQKGFESIQGAYNGAQQDGLTMPEITYVENEDIERLLPRDAVHQGVLLDCQPLEETFLSDVLVAAGENAKILILDQVTDPHNVGAILRSASAFGAAAVIVQKVHAPDITGTLAKSASGAVEHVPLIREVNLSRTIEQLKEAGFFCIGLDERGKQTMADLKLSGKTAIVLGAEGDGLRRLVAENCDELVSLPTQGNIASLNVSNAAAVALYELSRA